MCKLQAEIAYIGLCDQHRPTLYQLIEIEILTSLLQSNIHYIDSDNLVLKVIYSSINRHDM